jgi:hypothetical protein
MIVPTSSHLVDLMALVSCDFSVSGVNTASSALLNLKAASTRSMTLIQVNVFYSVLSTTAYDIGLIRMNAVGTGTITSTAGVTYLSGDTGQGVLETAWATTRPTTTGKQFARGVIPLTIGAGFMWPIYMVGEGATIPPSGGICLIGNSASGATTGTLVGNFLWDE